jgi:hypothetical protein
MKIQIMKVRFVMLLRYRSNWNKESQLNEHYKNALMRNHVIILVPKIGFSFVSPLNSIIQKWMVIINLYLDKLN